MAPMAGTCSKAAVENLQPRRGVAAATKTLLLQAAAAVVAWAGARR